MRYLPSGEAVANIRIATTDTWKDKDGKVIKVADGEFRVIGLMEHKGQTLGFDLDDIVFIPDTWSSGFRSRP